MIRIAITAAACHAICLTLPEDASVARPSSGRPVCLIHLEATVLDRLWAMRRRSDDIRQTLTGAANGTMPRDVMTLGGRQGCAKSGQSR